MTAVRKDAGPPDCPGGLGLGTRAGAPRRAAAYAREGRRGPGRLRAGRPSAAPRRSRRMGSVYLLRVISISIGIAKCRYLHSTYCIHM